MPLLADLDFEQIKVNGAGAAEGCHFRQSRRQCRCRGRLPRCEPHRSRARGAGPDQHQGRPGRAFLAARLPCARRRQPPLQVTARIDEPMREQLGLKSTIWSRTDARHPAVRGSAWTRRRSGARKPISPGAAPVRRSGLDQARRPCRHAFSSILSRRRMARSTSTISDPRRRHRHPGRDRAGRRAPSQGIPLLRFFRQPPDPCRDQGHRSRRPGTGDQGARGRASMGDSSSNRCSRPASSSRRRRTPTNLSGVDLTAQIGTVAGLYDTTATDVHVTMKKRNGRLVALDGKGALNGSRPATVQLEQSGGSRADQGRSPQRGLSLPPGRLLSERGGRRGAAPSQSRCGRPRGR